MTNLEKITTPNPKIILDKVESHNISSFHSIYRIRGDLPFIKNENTGVERKSKIPFRINPGGLAVSYFHHYLGF